MQPRCHGFSQNGWQLHPILYMDLAHDSNDALMRFNPISHFCPHPANKQAVQSDAAGAIALALEAPDTAADPKLAASLQACLRALTTGQEASLKVRCRVWKQVGLTREAWL